MRANHNITDQAALGPEFDITPIDRKDKKRISQVAAVLYEAFLWGNDGQPDPFYDRPNRDRSFVDADYSKVLGFNKPDGSGPDVRKSHVFKLVRSATRTAAKAGHTLSLARSAGEIVGASWVKPAGVEDIGYWGFVRSFAITAPLAFGLRGTIQYARDANEHLHTADLADTYISMVGVRPDWQRFGLGGELIKRALADAAGSRVTLCTMNPDNVPMYNHMGFEQYDQVGEEGSGLVTVYMARQGQAAATRAA
jgi:GNAT superfamily N-acetyltransferase